MTDKPDVAERGVIYLACGPKHVEALTASLWSLRQFYAGNVSIYCDERSLEDVVRIASAMGASVQLLRYSFTNRRYFYFLKTLVCVASPYHQTLFLDADTLIIKNIDEIWKYKLAFTQQWYYGAPLYLGSRCFPASRRRRQMKLVSSKCTDLECIKQAEDALAHKAHIPAINTGVFLYTDLPDVIRAIPPTYGKMLDIASSDETVLTLLWREHCQHAMVLDDSWNKLDQQDSREPRIHSREPRILHFPDRSWHRSILWDEVYNQAQNAVTHSVHRCP